MQQMQLKSKVYMIFQVVKSKQEVADTKSKVLDKINAIQTQAKVKPAADTEVENAYNTRKQEF